MTPVTFKEELIGMLSRAKEDMSLSIIHDILMDEVYALTGEMSLYKHYNGDVPPRLKPPEPRTTWPVDRGDSCSFLKRRPKPRLSPAQQI